MRAAIFVQMLPEMLKFLEAREKTLENRIGGKLISRAEYCVTKGKLAEVRRMMNILRAKRDLHQEEREVCLTT